MRCPHCGQVHPPNASYCPSTGRRLTASKSLLAQRIAIALFSIVVLGIAVLRSKEPLETAKLMVYATRQIRSVTGGGLQRPGYRPKNKRTRQLYILQGLPGIGRERAIRLLDHFGSVKAVMTASRDELESVDGIGKDTAEKMKWAISEKITPYGLYDDFPI